MKRELTISAKKKVNEMIEASGATINKKAKKALIKSIVADVEDCADPVNWSDGDITIGLRRSLESKIDLIRPNRIKEEHSDLFTHAHKYVNNLRIELGMDRFDDGGLDVVANFMAIKIKKTIRKRKKAPRFSAAFSAFLSS